MAGHPRTPGVCQPPRAAVAMRRRTIKILCITAIFVLALHLLVPGYVLVQVAGWTLETRPISVFLLALVAVWLIWLSSRGFDLMRHAPARLRQRQHARSHLKAVRALLGENPERARKLFKELPQRSELDEIACALSASEQGDAREVRAALQRLQRLQPSWKKSIDKLRARLLSKDS